MKSSSSTPIKLSNLSLGLLGRKVARFAPIVLIAMFGLGYAYILLLSGSLNEAQPSATSVEEQVKTTTRPKVDESVAQTMINLEDQNVDIQSIFDEARENPFTEQ